MKRIAKSILGLGAVLLLLSLPMLFAASRTFRVEETEFVKLRPEVIDADNDQLIFTYSPPLDERGEWQTDYDDAGEYDLEITASDGVHSTTEKIKLIVENKNQPPLLQENKLTIKESQVADLKSLVDDPDGDVLLYRFPAPFDADGRWQTSLDDAGRQVITFSVSDGSVEETMRAELEVLNTNQAPLITETFSPPGEVIIAEDDTLYFQAGADDLDGDEIRYRWELGETVLGEAEEGEHYFDFESAGEYQLTLTVSDGELSAAKIWTVQVQPVNRPPEFSLLPITVEEGDLVEVEVPETDVDGDALSYSFGAPLEEDGTWQTGYDDAGTYDIEITASDGELTSQTDITVQVLNVDRAPVIETPARVDAWEGQLVQWSITASDPDDEPVTVSVEGLPEGAVLENGTLSWTPPFDTLQRRGGFFSNLLNRLRLEHFFLRQGRMRLTAQACSGQLCSSAETELFVHNVNRPPEFTSLEELTVRETETAELTPEAVDPDGDIVHYYFTAPLGRKNGKWKTGYDDAAVYEVYVTATDGRQGTTEPVALRVLNTNRPPKMKVTPAQVVLNEGEEFSLQASATDADGDELTLLVKDLPEGASFADGVFTWTPGFDTVQFDTERKRVSSWRNDFVSRSPILNRHFSTEKEVLWLEFMATDGEFNSTFPVKAAVKNVNQPPEIIDYLPSAQYTVQVQQPVLFHAAVKDPDNDELSLLWKFDEDTTVQNAATVRHTFVSPGVKKVAFTASDGRKEVRQEWGITVEDVPYVPPAEPVVPPTFKVYVITSDPPG